MKLVAFTRTTDSYKPLRSMAATCVGLNIARRGLSLLILTVSESLATGPRAHFVTGIGQSNSRRPWTSRIACRKDIRNSALFKVSSWVSNIAGRPVKARISADPVSRAIVS